MGSKYKDIMTSNLLVPGPGTYLPTQTDNLDHKLPVKLKSRIMFFYGKSTIILDEDIMKQKHCISPQKYLPSRKAVEPGRYRELSFGLGKRTTVESKSNRDNPGPGAHELPSIFDKNRSKLPLN